MEQRIRDERSQYVPGRVRRELHAASGALQVFASPTRSQQQQQQQQHLQNQQQQPQLRGASNPATIADNASARSSSGGYSTSSSSSSSSSDSDDDDDDASTASSSSSSSDGNSPPSSPTSPAAPPIPAAPAAAPAATAAAAAAVSSSSSKSKEDKSIFRPGDVVGASRFEVVSELGRGAFSCVYVAKRREKPGTSSNGNSNGNINNSNNNSGDCSAESGADQLYAMKVYRQGRRYDFSAIHEWDTLQALTKAYGRNKAALSTVLGFRSRNTHSCLLFPLAGPSLLQVLKSYHPRSGLPDLYVRSIAYQVIQHCAQLHACSIINTDIKPENIVFVSRARIPSMSLPVHSQIAMIDFSNAVFRFRDLTPAQQQELPAGVPRHHEEGPAVIQTRHYRAPEVLFGARWSFPCDMWSAGCTIVETVKNACLFMTHDDSEHIAMMYHLLGPPPPEALVEFSEAPHFKRLLVGAGERPRWPTDATRPADIDYVFSLPTLEAVFRNNTSVGSTSTSNSDLHDLVKRLLAWSPKDRITAEQALRHPFFTRERPPSV